MVWGGKKVTVAHPDDSKIVSRNESSAKIKFYIHYWGKILLWTIYFS